MEITKQPGDEINFSKIENLRVINESPNIKSIFLEGSYEGKSIILLISKNSFGGIVPQLSSPTFKTFNDIYRQYSAKDESSLSITTIWPATDFLFEKYSRQKVDIYNETFEVYQKVTLPMIESEPPENLQWVYNILDGKAETESVLYQDKDPETGFLISKNFLRWDEKDNEMLYLNVIFEKRLYTIRSLTNEHIPMLKKVREKIYSVVQEKYNSDKIKIFFHYLPTYFHLHLHIVGFGVQDNKMIVGGTSILLDDVIENMELMKDYYQKKSITLMAPENHSFSIKYREVYGNLK